MDKIVTVTLSGGIKDTVTVPNTASAHDIEDILNKKFGELGWCEWNINK